MGKVTIKDVAREAGVSISTVSNALNGVDVVLPETKAHILEVADRLHYIPNMNGRNLKTKATKTIGLLVTSLKGPYFGILADTLFWECKKNGYDFNIFVTWDSQSAMNNVLGNRVDGWIILDNDIQEPEENRIFAYEIPTVFLYREASGEKASSVVFDSYHDGVMATEYLLQKKPQKIAFVQGVWNNYDAKQRYQGFMDTLARHDMEVEPEYILNGSFERYTAHDAMQEFLQKKLPIPDAIFAANDLSAIGCMDVLLEAGYHIPEDIIVMGVDDIELGEWYRPALTTIRTGIEKQAVVAVEKMMTLLTGEARGDITKIQGTLIERQSTDKNAGAD